VTKQVAYGVNPAVSGYCASNNQLTCLNVSDCPSFTGYWNPPYMNGVENGAYPNLCKVSLSITELKNNGCQIFNSNTGKYCQKVPAQGEELLYPPQYNSDYRFCNNNTDCDVSENEECRQLNYNWAVSNDVLGLFRRVYSELVNATPVTDDTIQRIIAFADNTDDVFGFPNI
jgi:hypothetical protein